MVGTGNRRRVDCCASAAGTIGPGEDGSLHGGKLTHLRPIRQDPRRDRSTGSETGEFLEPLNEASPGAR